MDLLQTIVISIVQGITELFPVSSVAHAVLTPALLHWNLTPQFLRENFLPFVVMLHLGTALALLLYFWRDWLGFAASVTGRDSGVARRELWLVVIGTVPAAAIGFVFEHQLRDIFPSAASAGFFLIINGVILFAGERLRGRGERSLADLGIVEALLIGLAQSLALVPGFSRSGASMVAGFIAGLSHEAAARFSMLLATPIIAGASLVELPKLLHGAHEVLTNALIGGLVSGVVALVSVWLLMRWFSRHESDAMLPFAVYCWLLGAVAILYAP